MYKMTFILVALLLTISPTKAQEITIADIWETYSFYPNYVPGFNFMNDGVRYSVKEGNRIVTYKITDGQIDGQIFSTDEINFSSYTFNSDESKIILETESESIYRRSSKANYYLYDRKSKSLKQLSDKGKQSYPNFDHSGQKVAFARDNNLFIKDMRTQKERAITTDGKFNAVINGSADWVYEEEFAMSQAYQWSPDGQQIAYIRFDESDVKEFTMTNYRGDLYPEYETFKYPKAGEKNAEVSVHIYDLESAKTIKVPVKGDDIYIPRVKWKSNDELIITKMNRHQNHLELLCYNTAKKSLKIVFEEKNEYFIDLHDNMTFLDKDQFLWTSDESGFNHIHVKTFGSKKSKQLTKGDYDVTKVYGMDKSGWIYFQAAKESATQRGIYKVSLSGEMVELNPHIGSNSAQFSGTYQYFVNTFSKAGQPPVFEVYETRSKKRIRVIEDNAVLTEKLADMNLSDQGFFDFTTPEGTRLEGWMIKPLNFDPNKKYPVLMYVYGGPGAQTVKDNWGGQNFMWFQMLAQKGYIVVSIDNRGTDARGEAFRKSTYMELGKLEAVDQIFGAQYLASLPYVDGDRIGIFGWSFGGYLSSLCLAKGNDVFKMAIAVAPVTNWKWYDTIYTERYMRTPAENESGYEENSPVNFADRIKGPYLLVHGFADDNVHFQNAAEMARALVKANIPFEQAFYPNKNHGIYGGLTRAHLFTKMTDFLEKNL